MLFIKVKNIIIALCIITAFSTTALADSAVSMAEKLDMLNKHIQSLKDELSRVEKMAQAFAKEANIETKLETELIAKQETKQDAKLGTELNAKLDANKTTEVSSKNLTHILENVKFSGYLSYRMEKYIEKDSEYREAQHDIYAILQAVMPITNNYSATFRIFQSNNNDTDLDPSELYYYNYDNSSYMHDRAFRKDSSALQAEFDRVYFTYKNDNLKVTAGMQELLAPNFHYYLNGDGMKFSYEIDKSLILGGGYFYNTNLGTDEVMGLSVKGKSGMLSYNTSYIAVVDSDENNGNDGSPADNGAQIIDANIGIDLSGLNIDFAYTVKSLNASGSKEQSLAKLIVSGKNGDLKYKVGYSRSGKDGANVALEGDYWGKWTKVNLLLYWVSSAYVADGNTFFAMGEYRLFDTYYGKLEYLIAEGKGDVKEASEYRVTLTNKITKKFKLFADYNYWGIKTDTTKEYKAVMLGATYSF